MNKEEFFWKFFLNIDYFFWLFEKFLRILSEGSKWIFGGSSNLIPGFFWRKSAKIVEEILWYSKIIESECCEYSLKICDDRFLSFQSSSSENHLFAIIWYRISSDFTEINSFNSIKMIRVKCRTFRKKSILFSVIFWFLDEKKSKKIFGFWKKLFGDHSSRLHKTIQKAASIFWRKAANFFEILLKIFSESDDEIRRRNQMKSSEEIIRRNHQMKISDENIRWKFNLKNSMKYFFQKICKKKGYFYFTLFLPFFNFT